MGKKWTKCYLLFGTILMVVLSAICSLSFVKNNIQQAQDKKTFESIYADTTIDFIVPSPSYTQVEEIEKSPDTGIAFFTPYYETTTNITVEDKPAKGTTIILPEERKVQYTPYGSSRIVSGQNEIATGSAVADRIFVEKNGCHIGDTVSLRISDHDYTFIISGVAETNTYYSDGTIAVVLSDEQAKQLQDNGLKYSAAYVAASDYEKCKLYLYNDYKPYGRLKNEESFDNKDAYNQHVQNFESADWAKEITNCKDNYSSLSVKYENVESGILRNIFIAAIIVFLVVIIMNSALLRQEELRKFLQGYLIKKSGTKEEIKKFYINGIAINTIAFTAATFAFYYWIASSANLKFFSISLITSMVMIAAQIVASAIMSVVSSRFVEKKYTIKKGKTDNVREFNREATDSYKLHIKEGEDEEINLEDPQQGSSSIMGRGDQKTEDVQEISNIEETALKDDNAEDSPKSFEEDDESDNAQINRGSIE